MHFAWKLAGGSASLGMSYEYLATAIVVHHLKGGGVPFSLLLPFHTSPFSSHCFHLIIFLPHVFLLHLKDDFPHLQKTICCRPQLCSCRYSDIFGIFLKIPSPHGYLKKLTYKVSNRCTKMNLAISHKS